MRLRFTPLLAVSMLPVTTLFALGKPVPFDRSPGDNIVAGERLTNPFYTLHAEFRAGQASFFIEKISLAKALFPELIALYTVEEQTGTSTGACSTASTTAQMLDCENDRLAKADTDLNRVYSQLLQQQNTAEKRQLQATEAAWLRFRDANAEFHASAAEGGTMGPLLRTTSKADATEARTLELRKMLH